MITVSVQGDSPKTIIASLLALAATMGSTPVVAQAVESEADKPKAEVKSNKPKAEVKSNKGNKADKPKTDIDLPSLRELGKAAIKANKNKEMRELLGQLGSESITALDEEKYAEFKAGIEAIINGDDDAGSSDDDAL